MFRNVCSPALPREPRRVHLSQPHTGGAAPAEQLATVKELIANAFLAEERVIVVLNGGSKRLSFPASSAREALQFSQCVRVMCLLNSNIQQKYTATRRDVFYQDVELFRSQSVVDSLIESIGRSMGCTGEQLGAVASQKGLVHGDVSVISNDGEIKRLCGAEGTTSVLIPRLGELGEILPSRDVKYILLVEKEAVFHALVTCPSAFPVKRIVITAKGFPDVLTRMFVHRITGKMAGVPVFGFSDFDPYGLNILQMYRTGGSHKNYNREEMSCPSLRLTNASIADFVNGSSCLPLPSKDFIYCKNILARWSEADLKGTWRREMQRMMFFGKKAELDVIKSKQESTEHALVEYIDSKCQEALRMAEGMAPLYPQSLK